MKTGLRIQLSLMMFIQFFIWGSWYVTAPNYLGTIGFQAADFGWTYSVGPIAGMLSPFFVGMIADRFFAAQRVLGVMHLMGAGLMFVATLMMKGASPSPTVINLAALEMAFVMLVESSLSFLGIGILMFIVLGALHVIFPIIGALQASSGKLWRYPLSINFFDPDSTV